MDEVIAGFGLEVDDQEDTSSVKLRLDSLFEGSTSAKLPAPALTAAVFRQAGLLDKDPALAYFALGRALAGRDLALSRRCYHRYVQLAQEKASENVKLRLAEASAAGN
jgi:hypothetical protein